MNKMVHMQLSGTILRGFFKTIFHPLFHLLLKKTSPPIKKDSLQYNKKKSNRWTRFSRFSHDLDKMGSSSFRIDSEPRSEVDNTHLLDL
ncbi:hypothetical protein GDO81_014439 [Engystomops pustulosus]|uniref:Uncharacterized protein n=1 Tax=Engystomops pustulosus TaxID=76066 RepID=A0AAV7BAN9_ENGPU|nr:hypothetical protein GDO81_014439 [Engystomops pustulosus]